MNGKDLLAVVAMILPGILLTALIALSMVPASVMQPFPGSGNMSGQPGAGKSAVLRETPAGSMPRKATQKRMRNPWEKATYASNQLLAGPAPGHRANLISVHQ